MATPVHGRIERLLAAILAAGMRRREFIAGLLVAATLRPARAQQSAKVHRIAVISPATPTADITETSSLRPWRAFFKELRRLGYVGGRNLIVERYSGEGRTEHYAKLTRDVVRSKPDVIVAGGVLLLRHVKAATAAIPIVGTMAEPVGFGLVASLAHPGGNLTGVSIDAGIEVWSKRLELLKEAVSGASRMGFLVSRYNWQGPTGAVSREAARQIGISLIAPLLEGTIQEPELSRVFEAITQEHVGALIVSADPENLANRRLIVELAEKNRLPAIYPYHEFVEVGGLMAYAADPADLWTRAAGYVDQILKGASPGDIPVYQAAKFELVVNVKAANTIGLTLPPALVLRADEVIE
jgi:putative tryptophan/tyrosine transport system substrate-binding protein